MAVLLCLDIWNINFVPWKHEKVWPQLSRQFCHNRVDLISWAGILTAAQCWENRGSKWPWGPIAKRQVDMFFSMICISDEWYQEMERFIIIIPLTLTFFLFLTTLLTKNVWESFISDFGPQYSHYTCYPDDCALALSSSIYSTIIIAVLTGLLKEVIAQKTFTIYPQDRQ